MRRCYCEGYCPNELDSGTCVIQPGGKCFISVVAEYDDEGNEIEITSYGCLSANEGGLMQCMAHLVPHKQRKTIQCCDDSDLCNRKLDPTNHHKPTTKTPDLNDCNLPLVVIFTCLSISILVVVAVLLYIKYHRAKMQRKWFDTESHPNVEIREPLNDLIEQSSASGSGLPLLVQRTISKQIQMINSVGKGRYGEVWQAKWRGQKVAVKVFYTTEEQSWFRETEIYQTVFMRHDNILGFIAADIKGTGSWTQMLLITEYHENGSLYDYLQTNHLDPSSLLLMAQSIISGLCHLHLEVFGTRGKPSIAHRDVKSKNILVKRNGECCLADFGLAVKYLSDLRKIDVPPNARSGTIRYMAPELLDNTINVHNIEAHNSADMYAFGLVLWEMARRCVTGEKLMFSEEYQMPFYDCVPSNPSVEDMQQVVCVKKVRPHIPKRWAEDSVLQMLSKVMQECWHRSPAVRLTSLRVKKTLSKVATETSIKIV
ncbi:bone morphogenetic protein receptor type-1B-like [Aethina tumida]|uniref:bone morphogenetic protein receptor type-1B-like n=1 Tax=Aethina tumida TaxID=116153 RepID=UPI0021496A1F|nr:bone morphogenetic protein receptor type-1B-like [Aethina tumida]XP_049824819.1 bone morphogenetic protein receptor type-1B-like [Aethina tumida]XP_049824820.1 bone morphogenetic protein receptor type-1B-like [Aethina tumida]